MNRRSVVLIISAVILAVFAAAAFFYSSSQLQSPQQAEAPGSTAQKTAAQPKQSGGQLVRSHSPVFGPVQAPVTIVEFFDPSCEACRAFHPYVKQILAENPEDVRLVLRYVLFHPGSEEVARMLEAARKQNLHEQVLEAQPGWHDDPKVAQAWAAAERVGLNLEQARQDMHAPGVNAVLETDMQDVMAVGVRGTPTFFVNGRALSEFGPEPLRQLVSSEVAKTSL